ncbi:hypothetical protein [Haemophilus haemolyticus]|uniref:hypothetical protein n=1 Tax=Haemophilus haemolyticus TaxID=726 RepID=UPI000E58B366|nr:hypothetical protein [Haemophilus haemolyticus]
MGHQIRAQIGKGNTSGNANNVTQIGIGNQNNSNNTTNNYYNNTPKNNNEISSIAGVGVAAIIIIAAINYYLFKYADCISKTILYLHVFLLLNLISVYNLFKIGDFDKKDFFNLILIFLIGLISFLYAKELFSMEKFHALSKYAQNKSFSEYWEMVREWKVYSIYFLISSILSVVLLVMNLIYTYKFLSYSIASKTQSNLIGMFVALLVAAGSYYFIITEPKFLLSCINDIKLIK